MLVSVVWRYLIKLVSVFNVQTQMSQSQLLVSWLFINFERMEIFNMKKLSKKQLKKVLGGGAGGSNGSWGP